MPATSPPDRYQPSFYRFPIQNDRTGFKPVCLPVILVVPGRRVDGFTLAHSEVRDVRYYVADAPDPSKVAGEFIYTQEGPQVNNILVPQLSLFVVNISSVELEDVRIDPTERVFYDPSGNIKSFDDAAEGDSFEYTLIRGNVKSTIPWYPDADYYDMSVFTIDVEDLPRPKRYRFIWECRYNHRMTRSIVSTISNGGICIEEDDTSVAQFQMLINHPGEVHQDLFKKTPPFYFDNNNFRLADDPILEFYRPFADILQDAFDEQTFLNGINHLDKIPAQLIPYLAFLIGWDLPNFPGVTDTVRRSVLRHAVRLQKLKGSRRALIELFEIFGFTIDLINLWYSTTGDRLIAPGEELPTELASNEITVTTVHNVEPLVTANQENGFGQFEVPLLYKASDDVTIIAYRVNEGATADALQAIADNIEDNPDVSLATQLQNIPTTTLIAKSEVTVDNKTGLANSSASTSSIPLLNEIGVTLDVLTNVITVNYDHYLDLSDGSMIYIFASYDRDRLNIPEAVQNLRSNRFDVKILLQDGQVPAPLLLEFLLNFVFKLKSFHSLLRKIAFDLGVVDVYNVTDFCLTPSASGSGSAADPCAEATNSEQLDLIYKSLLEEFKTWRDLDGTHAGGSTLDDLLRIPVNSPKGDSCQFTSYGQDRVLVDPNVDLDHNPDERKTLCPDTPPLPPHCFKGRVHDDLILEPTVHLCEIVRSKPCSLGMGSGFYWTYPQNVLSVLRDGFGKFKGQNKTSFLGRQIAGYGRPLPNSLHFTNRPYLETYQLKTDQLLGYRRPSIEVQKDNLWYPGHRFVTMNKLESDFTHPSWNAKPWDDENNDLNCQLGVDTSGDQILIFDVTPLTYTGNNLQPDVSSLGSHEPRSFLVTHKVYLVNRKPGHPAITLDPRVVETTEESIEFDSSVPFGPIFKSYNSSCNKDFRDGYPAVYNEFEYDSHSVDFDRGGSDSLTAESLGMVTRSVGTECSTTDGACSLSALFTCGSGILLTPDDVEWRYYEPYRVDCDCERYDCDATGDGTTGASGTEITAAADVHLNIDPCILNNFRLPNGNYDFGIDQLDITPKMVLAEKIGVCSTVIDGTLNNMLSILLNGQANSDIQPTGSFKFKDTWGMIYEGSWTYNDSGILDLAYLTKIPYVWGEPIQGFTRGRLVFRKGIITNYRKVIHINPVTKAYRILANLSEQRVDFFQINTGCGDPPFVDNFSFHVDCAVQDNVDPIVVCGTRWVAYDDYGVAWGDLELDSAGNVVSVQAVSGKQLFSFMDVWENAEDADITALCTAGTGTS